VADKTIEEKYLSLQKSFMSIVKDSIRKSEIIEEHKKTISTLRELLIDKLKKEN